MNRDEMVDFYKSITNQEDNFLDPADVTSLINRAIMDFQRKVRILENAEPQDINAGQASYPVPSDSMEVMRIEVTATTGFREEIFATKRESLTIESLNWRQDTGEPTQYFIDLGGKNIVLYPEPDTTISLGMNVEYKQRPNTLVLGTDVSILPEEHHEVPIYRAAALGFLRDGDADQYRAMNTLYKEEVAISKVLLSRRTTALRLRKRGHFIKGGRVPLNLGNDSPRSI